MSRSRILGEAGNDVSVTGLTLSGTQYSKPFTTNKGDHTSIHLEFTGTPTTAVTLWRSNKYEPNEANDNDWVQVPSGEITFTGAAGAGAKEFAELGNAAAALYRLKLVTSGGTGKASAWVNRTPGNAF